MKKLLVAIFILTSWQGAHATGKLSVQVNSFEQGEHVRPQVGLSVYEKLMKLGKVTTAFNSWTGVGDQPRELSPDVQWYTSKNQLDIRVKQWTVSPGVQLYYIRPYDELRSVGFLKVSYDLWD